MAALEARPSVRAACARCAARGFRVCLAMGRRLAAIESACEEVLSQSAARDASHRKHLLAGVPAAIALLGERFAGR